MYIEHFGFQEDPFGVSPNPRFLYLGTVHYEAFAALLYGVKMRRGFMCMTGDPGTGKTTLLYALLDRLEGSVKTVFLPGTDLTFKQRLQFILETLGVRRPGNTVLSLTRQLQDRLAEEWRAGRNVVLIIDEAQGLSVREMEDIRLLTNFETPQAKLMQLILVGQTQLKAKLDSPALAQLKQRITVNVRLKPLSPPEVAEYLEHRLHVADWKKPLPALFNRSVLNAVYKASEGNPRLINAVCHNAMLSAYAQNRLQLSVDMVWEAARELDLTEEIPSQRTTPYIGADSIADVHPDEALIDEAIMAQVGAEEAVSSLAAAQEKVLSQPSVGEIFGEQRVAEKAMSGEIGPRKATLREELAEAAGQDTIAGERPAAESIVSGGEDEVVAEEPAAESIVSGGEDEVVAEELAAESIVSGGEDEVVAEELAAESVFSELMPGATPSPRRPTDEVLPGRTTVAESVLQGRVAEDAIEDEKRDAPEATATQTEIPPQAPVRVEKKPSTSLLASDNGQETVTPAPSVAEKGQPAEMSRPVKSPPLAGHQPTMTLPDLDKLTMSAITSHELETMSMTDLRNRILSTRSRLGGADPRQPLISRILGKLEGSNLMPTIRPRPPSAKGEGKESSPLSDPDISGTTSDTPDSRTPRPPETVSPAFPPPAERMRSSRRIGLGIALLCLATLMTGVVAGVAIARYWPNSASLPAAPGVGQQQALLPDSMRHPVTEPSQNQAPPPSRSEATPETEPALSAPQQSEPAPPVDPGLEQTVPSADRVVTVRRNDTLGRILRREYGFINRRVVRSVIAANPDIEEWDYLEIGQKLTLPRNIQQDAVPSGEEL